MKTNQVSRKVFALLAIMACATFSMAQTPRVVLSHPQDRASQQMAPAQERFPMSVSQESSENQGADAQKTAGSQLASASSQTLSLKVAFDGKRDYKKFMKNMKAVAGVQPVAYCESEQIMVANFDKPAYRSSLPADSKLLMLSNADLSAAMIGAIGQKANHFVEPSIKYPNEVLVNCPDLKK